MLRQPPLRPWMGAGRALGTAIAACPLPGGFLQIRLCAAGIQKVAKRSFRVVDLVAGIGSAGGCIRSRCGL